MEKMVNATSSRLCVGRRVLLGTLLILSVMWLQAPAAEARVTRDQLATRVMAALQPILSGVQTTVSNTERSQRASAIAARIGANVRKMKADSLSDRAADWVRDSLVEMFTNRAGVLMGDPTNSEELLKSLDTVMAVRLGTFSDTTAEELLARRDRQVANNAAFHGMLTDTIAQRLAGAKVLRLVAPGGTMMFDHVGGFAMDFGLRDLLDKKGPSHSVKHLDLRGQSIESRILVLAAVRDLRNHLARDEVNSRIVSGSLFSYIFGGGPPVPPWALHDFDSAKSGVDQILDQAMKSTSDGLYYDGRSILSATTRATNLQWFNVAEPWQAKSAFDAPDHDEIIFDNVPEYWKEYLK